MHYPLLWALELHGRDACSPFAAMRAFCSRWAN
jgi:hypothetical protein